MKHLTTIILFLFSSAFFHGAEILKYDDYIKIISEKLPDIKLNENQVKMQELEVKKSYSAYDLNANTKFYGSGNQTQPDNENTIYNYSPAFGSNLTFTNTLPSGTELSTGFTYQQQYSSGEITSINSITGKEKTTEWQKTSYDPVINVGVTQPLLYNWFGFLNRYSIKSEKNKLKIEIITEELNNLNIITNYKKLYFQWIALDYKLELIEKTIENAKNQLAKTKEKVSLGLLKEDSLETMNYSLLQYEKQKKEYLSNYEKIRNQLSYFFNFDNIDPDKEFFIKIYNDYSGNGFEYIEFEETKNAQILNISKENYELLKKAKNNETMPHLDLFANIDVNFHYARKIDDGEETIYTFNDNDYKNINFTTGIELSFPIGNIKARNTQKQTELSIKSILLEYEQTKQKYNYNLKNILSYHQYIKGIITINENSLQSLLNKYKIQENQYKKGIAELDDLVTTDNSITTEKMNDIDMRVNLINNIIDYEYLTE